MFERMLLENTANARRRPWTVAVSVLFQCLLIGIAVLVPLFDTPAIARKVFVSLEPPLGPPVGSQRVVKQAPVKQPRSQFKEGRLLEPRQIPNEIATIVDAIVPDAPILESGPIGVPSGSPFGSRDWIAHTIGSKPVEPRPPIHPPKRTSDKIEVGGKVQQAKLIHQPKPIYPEWAKRIHLSGTVRLAAIISEAGAIEELRVLQGHPLLVQAAVDAVQQWRYRPTFLNGVPVKVETTIDVIFTLSQ